MTHLGVWAVVGDSPTGGACSETFWTKRTAVQLPWRHVKITARCVHNNHVTPAVTWINTQDASLSHSSSKREPVFCCRPETTPLSHSWEVESFPRKSVRYLSQTFPCSLAIFVLTLLAVSSVVSGSCYSECCGCLTTAACCEFVWICNDEHKTVSASLYLFFIFQHISPQSLIKPDLSLQVCSSCFALN